MERFLQKYDGRVTGVLRGFDRLVLRGTLRVLAATGGRVTRKLRLLRAHGIIRKVPRTHRYMFTKKGRDIATAILDSQDVTLAQLKKAAA